MLRQVIPLSCHVPDDLGMGSTLTPEEGPDGDNHNRLDDLAEKYGVLKISTDVNVDGLLQRREVERLTVTVRIVPGVKRFLPSILLDADANGL